MKADVKNEWQRKLIKKVVSLVKGKKKILRNTTLFHASAIVSAIYG